MMILLGAAGGQTLGSARAAAPWQEKNLYAGIFVTPDQQKPDPQKAPPTIRTLPGRVATAPPRVVCGMTIVQADPGVDPKMLVKPDLVNPGRANLEPNRGKIDFKIRALTPPVCH